jgi:predicted CXXCH cytochrome family protein
MCLRCHDGTIARDTIGGVAQAQFPNAQHPAFSTASHGATDHPVGVKYPQSDRGYRPLIVVRSRGAFSIPDGVIQCASCHDPHNTADHDYMLVVSNERSNLCLTCHNK